MSLPASAVPAEQVKILLDQVRDGYRSVRRAASDLGWTMEQVQMEIWGEIRL